MGKQLSVVAQRFFTTARDVGALKLDGGPFKTKAGRQSPYFLNMGGFGKSSVALWRLSEIYGMAVRGSEVEYDHLFGPAYKGIGLGQGLAIELGRHGIDVGFTYNRKEAKDHGEGGILVGPPMKGKRVLVVDDVISAGTALQESTQMITQAGGEVAGLVVALDRQETMVKNGVVSERSAVDEVRASGVPVIAVATLDDLMMYLEWADPPNAKEQIAAIKGYRARYGPKEPSL